ncbi:universal stress protein [Enterococcus sp. CSURQ0835]|uniref:universal stress protein n=1 Tax=Enterococcus sp. CSURQ0835 TaxID=2681394 RepID=UPI001359564F|nr:universal stress protein [Enterococcus sp. CSURQ0835]
MEAYKNILVPVDGSKQSTIAFQEAIEVAKRNDAHLTVMTVVDFKYSVGDPAFINDALKFHLNNAEIELDELIAQADLEEVDLQKEITAGSPKRKIIDYAKEHKIDLIMMGSTGTGALEQVLVGSTTAYIVNRAPCNVIVVKSNA